MVDGRIEHRCRWQREEKNRDTPGRWMKRTGIQVVDGRIEHGYRW